jgi:membrane protease YdiL (CAAX protease family)
MRAFAKRHSLPLYFVIAFAWFWALLALERVKPFRFWAALVGALAPAVAAVFITAVAEGDTAVRELVRRLWKWRVGWLWYVAAFGIPIAEGVVAVGIASACGVFQLARINTEMLRASLPGAWTVFLFAAGEELGWRGYALPRLLTRYNAIAATVILGCLHSLWHWPIILLPHRWMSDVPIVPWTAFVIAEAFVFTWIVRGTGGSVMLVTIFHGMSNAVMPFYDGIDPRWMPWIKCGVTVLATGILILATGSELTRKRTCRPDTVAGGPS